MKWPKLLRISLILAFSSLVFPGGSQARVLSYSKSGNRVLFRLDQGSLELHILSPDLVEVQYSILSPMPEPVSLVFPDKEPPAVAFSCSVTPGYVEVRTSRLIIRVDKSTQAISYLTLSGTLILQEDGSSGKKMVSARVAGFDTYTCSTQFLSPQDEGLFGLGCHPLDSGSIDYKGRKQDLAIRYMTGAIPFLLSTRGYGLLWDNYSASHFDGDVDQATRYRYSSESGKRIDYYFFYGPDFDQIISRYRQATGEAPMFPKWAFGLFQSQDRYMSQAEILSVKDQYRNHQIPVDAIVQDWFYWAPYPIGSHTMNPNHYPDPKAMVDALHQAHIHAMISIWPCFWYGSRDFQQLSSMGGLTNIRWNDVMTHQYDVYYDPFNPRARAAYWRQAADSLMIRDGWDGWWADQCEPDDGDSIVVRKQNMFYTGRGIDYFNAYSLMHTTAIYQGWRRDIPGKRVFILARQAFSGQQRNSATLWSSDVTCTFHSLQDQIPQGINACASGIPYWTSDIGGYHYNWTAPDWSSPSFRELFIRWFQFGTFSPIFRIHGKGERALYSKNWDDRTRAILLDFDNLRYRLMPYIYSLSWKVTQEGYTPMRSLAFDFRQDTGVYHIPDEYMFGPDFLVSPVSYPGADSRAVYLPRGREWYDFWTGKKIPGGGTIQAAAPLEHLPLFLPSGTILLMGPYLQYATEKPADPLEVRIYPGKDASFTLYEDAGDGYAYQNGQHATIRFYWNDRQQRLDIGGSVGSYPGMTRSRTIQVVLVEAGHGVGIKPEPKPDKTIRY
ncbi:MAG TPA: TIM-barrel domain-containing protein, partial [Chitinophagaceae bacterium]|nr:TIM-barrel domain-containing protein [Chitinophagaceae bacterium]